MLKKIINTFTTNVVIAILNLLIAIIVSQYLGAAGKGQQSILITTIAFVLLVCNIVGGASLVYLVPRYDNFKIVAPSYIWTAIVCLVLYFFIGIFQDISPVYAFHVCLLTLISSFTAINTTILLGREKIRSKNFIAVLQTFALIVSLLFMFLVLDQKSIESYIISLYIAFTVAFIVSSLYIIKFLNAPAGKQSPFGYVLKEMVHYGFLNQLSHITQLLSFRLSYYILLLYLGKDSVGIYSNAVSLVESVWLISKSIATVQYARIANSDNETYNQSITQRLLRSSLLVSFFILLPMAMLPSAFYKMLFGQEFGSVNLLIVILAPGVFFYNFSLIIGHYFSGKGRYHINSIASAIGLVVTVGFCWMLIPFIGIYGAAIAAVLSFVTTSGYVFYIFRKETGFPVKSFFPGKSDITEYKNYIVSVFSRKR